MEQEKKKINVKIIIPIVVVIIAVIIGIILFINSGTSNKECIGTWKITNNDKYYMPTIILYKGGTGKGLEKDEKSFHIISWEIKDNILNLTIDGNFFSGQYTERIHCRKR